MFSSEQCLSHAYLCSSRANLTREPHLISIYLRLAEEWQVLAEILDRNRGDPGLPLNFLPPDNGT